MDWQSRDHDQNQHSRVRSHASRVKKRERGHGCHSEVKGQGREGQKGGGGTAVLASHPVSGAGGRRSRPPDARGGRGRGGGQGDAPPGHPPDPPEPPHPPDDPLEGRQPALLSATSSPPVGPCAGARCTIIFMYFVTLRFFGHLQGGPQASHCGSADAPPVQSGLSRARPGRASFQVPNTSRACLAAAGYCRTWTRPVASSPLGIRAARLRGSRASRLRAGRRRPGRPA